MKLLSAKVQFMPEEIEGLTDERVEEMIQKNFNLPNKIHLVGVEFIKSNITSIVDIFEKPIHESTIVEFVQS